MAIKFTRARYFTTPTNNHLLNNALVGSQSFKIRVDSCPNPGAIPGNTGLLRRNGASFAHVINPGTSPILQVALAGAGVAAANVPLRVGVTYVICMTWNGTAAVQNLYVNKIGQRLG